MLLDKPPFLVSYAPLKTPLIVLRIYYRHKIDDTQHAAYLGEADSNDSDEADREVNPEAYRHRIDDPGSSGEHGQPGEGDEPVEKNR